MGWNVVLLLLLGTFSFWSNFLSFHTCQNIRFSYFQNFQIFRKFLTFRNFQNFRIFQIFRFFSIFIGFSCFCSSSFNYTSDPKITWLRLVVCKTSFYLFFSSNRYVQECKLTSIFPEWMVSGTNWLEGRPLMSNIRNLGNEFLWSIFSKNRSLRNDEKLPSEKIPKLNPLKGLKLNILFSPITHLNLCIRDLGRSEWFPKEVSPHKSGPNFV